MRILGQYISEKTQINYEKIISELRCEVVIKKLDVKKHPNRNGYTYFFDNIHEVFLNLKCSEHLFENTLLHELLHCKQGENGLPGLLPAYKDQVLLLYASGINSLIADIDVENQLTSMDMHSDENDMLRYHDLLSMQEEQYDEPKMRNIYVNLCANMIGLMYFTDPNKNRYREVLKAFNSDPETIIQSERIINIIQDNGYMTPRQQMRSIRKVALCYGLEGKLKLQYNGTESLI